MVCVCVCGMTLLLVVPSFSMAFARVQPVAPRFNIVGLNISYSCRTLIPFGNRESLTADVDVFRPDGAVIAANGGRVGVTEIRSTQNYERILHFVPISAADGGSYRCTGTIRPVVENSLVINRREETVQDILLSG
jgi:hypothetical protein